MDMKPTHISYTHTDGQTTGDELNALQEADLQREWLSYEEARRLVGLSRSTLYRLVKAGEVKGAQIGRSVRINRTSLEAYMEAQVVGGDEG
jgi:excisionase family DNA binding protein